MSRTEPVASDATWTLREVDLVLRRGVVTVRLLRIRGRWLASISTADGPTLGCDASPYLAVHRAAEPIGASLAEVMAALPAGLATAHRTEGH